jgi:hypothetical protein
MQSVTLCFGAWLFHEIGNGVAVNMTVWELLVQLQFVKRIGRLSNMFFNRKQG